MSGFICCFWWFLLGLLLGWLLNWLFDKFFRRGGSSGGGAASYRAPTLHTPTPAPVSPPPAPSPPASAFGSAASTVGTVSGAASASLASAAAAFGFSNLKSANGYDNFEIIEGIGPKINGVLHAAGVHTFPALAEMDVAAISKILDAAGPNFKFANPQTWAQQAGLCASGSWDVLKQLQDELVAGVELKPDLA